MMNSLNNKIICYAIFLLPPDQICIKWLFLSCLSVLHLSTLTFAITFEPYLACNSTNDVLSNNTKVNDLLTLTLTFILKIAFSDFVATGGIVFLKYNLFCTLFDHLFQPRQFSFSHTLLYRFLVTWTNEWHQTCNSLSHDFPFHKAIS